MHASVHDTRAAPRSAGGGWKRCAAARGTLVLKKGKLLPCSPHLAAAPTVAAHGLGVLFWRGEWERVPVCGSPSSRQKPIGLLAGVRKTKKNFGLLNLTLCFVFPHPVVFPTPPPNPRPNAARCSYRGARPRRPARGTCLGEAAVATVRPHWRNAAFLTVGGGSRPCLPRSATACRPSTVDRGRARPLTGLAAAMRAGKSVKRACFCWGRPQPRAGSGARAVWGPGRQAAPLIGPTARRTMPQPTRGRASEVAGCRAAAEKHGGEAPAAPETKKRATPGVAARIAPRFGRPARRRPAYAGRLRPAPAPRAGAASVWGR